MVSEYKIHINFVTEKILFLEYIIYKGSSTQMNTPDKNRLPSRRNLVAYRKKTHR